MRARVLLVDDNQEFLDSTTALLGPHFEIVGLARNGLEAVAEYRRLRPDLVVLDVSMPVMDGVSAARELGKLQEDVKIVFLSIDHSSDLREIARDTGALGCVSKVRMHTDLLPAVKSALEGRSSLSSSAD